MRKTDVRFFLIEELLSVALEKLSVLEEEPSETVKSIQEAVEIAVRLVRGMRK